MRNPSRSTEAESVRVLREARELGWTEERIRRAIGFGRGEHRYIVDRVVDPEEFLGAGYLNAVDQDGNSVVYPAVREAYVEICSGAYDECVLSGAIGVGKTQLAVYIQAYELYKLLCFRSPHAAFALDPSSEITIAFQSLSLELSEDGAFQRLRKLIDAAPVFQGTEFRYDPAKKSQLAFRNNIVVKPVSGEEAGTLGQNLISGVLDELNHMAYVEHSKRTRDQGAYDQAQALYDAIRRRRQSRFMRDGQLPGMLCLVSSKRYPGEFTERKAAEARQPGSRVYLYDKKIWEVKPSAYGTARFRVFSGDFTRPPRILRKDETMPGDEDRILAVPIELRADFERDLPGALRDLGGVSTQVCSPFLPNRSAVAAIFRKAPQILSRTETDFVSSGLTVPAGAWRSTEQFPRYVHLDLSRSRDSTGIALAHVTRFIRLARTG